MSMIKIIKSLLLTRYHPFLIIVLLGIPLFVQAGVVIQPTPTTGLRAHWTFDSKTLNWGANTVSDISGNGNVGTLVSMSASGNQVAGKRGQGLFFDGNVDSVSLVSNPISTVSNSSSVCAWSNTNNVAASTGGFNQTIINMYTDTNNGIHMGSIVNTGNLFASYQSQGVHYGAQSTGVVFTNNTWVHVCYVWNGMGIALYANGSAIASTTNSDSAGLVNTIGAHDDLGDGAWSGMIDDLRIYNRALSIAEIKQIYNSGALVLNSLQGNKTVVLQKTPSNFLTSGLVGYWSFDGSKINWASNTVTDSSGNGNTGTMISMSTTTSPAQGKIGQALTFDGSDDHVIVGTTNLPTTNDGTISVWVKIASSPSGTDIVLSHYSTVAPSLGYYKLVLSGGNRPILYNLCSNGGEGICTSDSGITLTPNIWYHIVGTFGGLDEFDSGIIYVNAVVKATGGFSTFYNIPAGVVFRVGSDIDGTNFCNCTIDDVRIYNRTLSATEVSQLYRLGR